LLFVICYLVLQFKAGVSHAASEFLVMKTQIPKWFKENFGLCVILLAQNKWWV